MGEAMEVLLLRRGRAASFMGSATVFPGGAMDEGENAQNAAVRELFEEAGVLLATDDNGVAVSVDQTTSLRQDMNTGTPINELLVSRKLRWDLSALHPWSRWITPSVEPKRFEATFFVAQLPTLQVASCDRSETVEHHWLTPRQALARGAQLLLPPPQIRTLHEIAAFANFQDLVAASEQRDGLLHPILPKRGVDVRGFCLMLPWDPQYLSHGHGDALVMNNPPHWAHGPSRFVKLPTGWIYTTVETP
jgi:8-oxo-dGTP pyrophosphatase MutT (NUDIX family)